MSINIFNKHIYYKKTFPDSFYRNFNSEELNKQFGEKTKKELENIDLKISIAGRIINKRIMGKASFIILQDMLDSKIQLYITKNNIKDECYEKKIKKYNLGDIIGVYGTLFKTNTGELSIRCYKIIFLKNTLHPLPDKFHGLVDKELCYRNRYLDLIVNKKSCKIFKIRSQIISTLRKFMFKKKFLEVETPMLHPIPGGANAKPFVTYHKSLNLKMYLRISPELYLKRLIIGGFEKIFEINRSFRNEGISSYHNPEFTMMELYMAYSNYKDLIPLIEELFLVVTKKVLGNSIIYYKNQKINFSKPFKKMTMQEAILKYYKNIKEEDFNNYEKMISIANNLNIQKNHTYSIGHIIAEIFEKKVKQYLIHPTIIDQYPIEVSPLARRNDKNPKIAERFEFFIGGYEIGNGFSELNDANDQSKRFKEQIKKYQNDQKENYYDNDYIQALEYGLPPTAGLGIGIDRMIMILTNSTNIRDVIFFPILRKS